MSFDSAAVKEQVREMQGEGFDVMSVQNWRKKVLGGG